MAERLWGEVERATNDGQAAFDKAEPHFTRAIDIDRAIQSENELAHSLAAIGRLHMDLGDRETGIGHLKEALAIYDRIGTIGAPDQARNALTETGVSS